MPIANPFVQNPGGSAGAAFGYGSPGNADQSQGMRRVAQNDDATSAIGTGSLTGAHNTPLHCAFFLIAALVVVFGLHFLGFRFTTAASMG